MAEDVGVEDKYHKGSGEKAGEGIGHEVVGV